MNNRNWDDIRFVLAVAQEGSLNAAAKKLKVTHATVLRRVATFEERCGRQIFLKAGTGYTVLPEAVGILEAAKNVEDAVVSIDRALLGSDQSLTGEIKIASTDSLCQAVLPEIIHGFASAHSELRVTLLSANTQHDLSRLSADIAVRPTPELEDGLAGEKVGILAFGAYSNGCEQNNWVGMSGPLRRSRPAKWMEENVEVERIPYSSDSFLVIREMIAEGFGTGFLPTFLGDGDARLEPVEISAEKITIPLWIATPEELARNVRIQAVWKLLSQALRERFSAA